MRKTWVQIPPSSSPVALGKSSIWLLLSFLTGQVGTDVLLHRCEAPKERTGMGNRHMEMGNPPAHDCSYQKEKESQEGRYALARSLSHICLQGSRKGELCTSTRLPTSAGEALSFLSSSVLPDVFQASSPRQGQPSFMLGLSKKREHSLLPWRCPSKLTPGGGAAPAFGLQH